MKAHSVALTDSRRLFNNGPMAEFLRTETTIKKRDYCINVEFYNNWSI